jgi:cation diffusion facilitator CzcD-associated flavoprotein CzcO
VDVVVVGGGMLGLAATAALKGAGIANMRVFDQAPRGREGPWRTYARMVTLRSPKNLPGPALGLGGLTFRAWYEAGHGEDGWDALGKIPRETWNDYLDWYRDTLALPVENGVRVAAIRPHGAHLALDLEDGGCGRTLVARKVVLATGRDGMGGPVVPAFARDLPADRHAHSLDAIDFSALAGKRVAVVGVGASGFDNAAEALEAGAAAVDVFARRPSIPRVNKMTGIGSPGLTHGFMRLDPIWKWRFMRYNELAQVPPPRESVLRVARHPNAQLHLDRAIDGARMEASRLRLDTRAGSWFGDFLILATGFAVDLARRPELAALTSHVALWRDRFTPPPEEPMDALLAYPWIGEGFELTERWPGACPALANLHCFTHAAMLSQGKNSSDIPAVTEGAQRLVDAVAGGLFVDEAGHHLDRLATFDKPELLGDEWPAAATSTARAAE